jgi:hypothetical protein
LRLANPYTGVMKLSHARLCLDCDEVHDEGHCPVCASESFAFIKRWVPASERRPRPPAASETSEASSEKAETVATYRALLSNNGESRMSAGRLLGGVTTGLALLGAAGWLLQRNGRDKSKTGEGSSSEPGPGTPDATPSA